MSTNIKVSVVIPVFNVAEYLDKCINSVISQDYNNIEIILVNDGSTDASPLICDMYAQKYTNIKVIHKSNGGASDARNSGVKTCNGDYILFLDGDDFWTETNAITALVNRVIVTSADVTNFSYTKYKEETKTEERYFKSTEAMPLLNNKAAQLDYLLSNNLYIASAWNKLIKKSVFSDDLQFEKGVYSEDITWCAKLLCKAASFDYYPFHFYYYRQNPNSVSHTINDKKCLDLCNNIIACFDIANSNDSLKKHLLFYTAYQFSTFFVVQALAKNKQTDCIDRLRPYVWILSYHNKNKKIMILNFMCKCFGYKLTCKFIRFFYRNRRK